MEEAQQEEKKEESQPEAKTEEKAEEKKEEGKKDEKEEVKPPEPVVLFVDMHCVGCAKKVERTILKVRGVEDVKINMIDDQVTVKGLVDPQALCTKIQNKTNRRASVVSPTLPEAEDAKPEVVNSQASEMSTVVLNINMHCEACALQLEKKILRMRGVQTAEADLASSKVTVTGTMDANKLIEYVYRRTRKQASILPPSPNTDEEKKGEKHTKEAKAEEKKEKEGKEKEEEKKEEENKDSEGKEKDQSKTEQKGDSDEEGKQVAVEEDALKKTVFYPPIYVIERVYAPQIFSDENPNACRIS